MSDKTHIKKQQFQQDEENSGDWLHDSVLKSTELYI